MKLSDDGRGVLSLQSHSCSMLQYNIVTCQYIVKMFLVLSICESTHVFSGICCTRQGMSQSLIFQLSNLHIIILVRLLLGRSDNNRQFKIELHCNVTIKSDYMCKKNRF